MSSLLSRTSMRTFVMWPMIVGVEQLIRRRPVRVRYLPMMLAGYLLFWGTGKYRTRIGGGGPGMARPPERLVTTGIYRRTRNPMYLGHLVFLTGLALATRSPIARLLPFAHLPWFDERAIHDEARLEEMFGAEYTRYRDSVPRWLGRPGAG